MKKLLALMMVFASLLPTISLAESPVTLFTNSWSASVNSYGYYVSVTNSEAALWTGPGYGYQNIGAFFWDDTTVRALTLATADNGEIWVLIDFVEVWWNWRGYVPISYFDAATRRSLAQNLPYEYSYDALTPMMVAQIYNACPGYYGPGSDYMEVLQLDNRIEGTLIMQDGEWVLIELNDVTRARLGCYGRVRVWIREDNCMY